MFIKSINSSLKAYKRYCIIIMRKADILNDQQPENESNQAIEQEQPQYGEVHGEVVKLKGLDYGLLKQEKEKEEKDKRNFMASLRDKINIISNDVLVRANGATDDGEKKKQYSSHDDEYRGLVKVLSNNKQGQKSHGHLSNNSKKSEVYLLFELDDFGRRVPMRVEKRIGKASNKPIFTHFDDKFCQELGRLIRASEQVGGNEGEARVERKEMVDEDDDDIFGHDSEEEQKDEKPKQANISIQIGKKLDFNIEEDIFSNQKRPKPIGPVEPATPETDKYSFMGKRVKPNKQQQQYDDGYGECYHQSGPSLQQLVDLKKQGIEYYGDLKEFKAKEKKAPNIHRQYEMIQKIIEKKNKQ